MIEIIIPVYNDARIFEILRSITENDKQGLTMMSIYEGCEDADYIPALKSTLRQVDRLFVENDSGIFNAFNKGLSNALSPVLVMMGADDCFGEGFEFETVLNQFNAHNSDLVISKLIYKKDDQITRRISYNRYLSEDFFRGVPFYHVGTFITRGLAQEFRFDEGYPTCADYKYFLEIFSETRKVGIVSCDVMIEEGGASGGWKIRIVALLNMIEILGLRRLIRHPMHFIVRYINKIKSLL
jgi:glycosyltransferase involved in cell wall biosynthesis